MKFLKKTFKLKLLSASVFMIFMSPPVIAQHLCSNVLRLEEPAALGEIRFTQDFIGYAWALRKLDELRVKYKSWLETHPGKNAGDFVLERTSNKPLPIIKDIEGRIRLVDNHHAFFSYHLLLGGLNSARFGIKLLKNYQENLNPATQLPWTREQFMEDLIENNWISLQGSSRPQWEDLQSLPQSVVELADNPARSLLSFTLRSLPVPIKGSDLRPHGQNEILEFLSPTIEEMSAHGGELVTEVNVDTLRDRILRDRPMLNRLLEILSPNLSSSKRKKIEDFIKEALSLLESSLRAL